MHRNQTTQTIAAVSLALVSLVGVHTSGRAQPAATTLRIVVPFPPGTPLDVLARDFGNRLPAVLGRSVIVENKTGAGGNIGTEFVISSNDGSTVLLTAHNPITINPLIYDKLRFNPVVDLMPVASIAAGGYVLATGPKSPYRTISDLVSAAKQKPNELAYASYGYGSMSHICMEQFQAMTGARLRHIPYRSSIAPDLIAGVVDVAFEVIAPSIPLIKDQRLKALAVTHKRVAPIPDVPAASEVIPGFECLSWVGVFAPKNMPVAARQQLASELTKMVRSPSYAAMTDILGGVPAPMEQKEFAEFVQEDAAKWRKLVPPLNIKLD